MLRRIAHATPELKDKMYELIQTLNDGDPSEYIPDELLVREYRLGRVGATYVVQVEFLNGDTEVGDLWFCSRCKEVREYFVGQVTGCFECGDDRDTPLA